MARNHSLIVFGAVAFGVLAPVAARAQSVRYPPDAADTDREAESRSALWESAIDPERAPYEDLVRDARHALEEQSEHGAQIAVDKLTDAIHRLPADPRAYGFRGEAYLVLHDWAHCAEDLEGSQARDAESSAGADRDRQELALGICQGREGHFPDAERTLVHAAEHAPRGEAWLRLGEVRIALGKLDEAIDALTLALDTSEGRSPVTHWLLAVAYDRARRPSPERSDNPPANDGQLALAADSSLGTLVHPPYPWLGTGEAEYLLGLAYSITPVSGSSMPEYALLYFRRFLAIATDSPWRARALEHVRALTALDWPQAVTRLSHSTTIVETSVLRAAISRATPALRACVAKQPTAAYKITIVKDGPKSPDAIDHARYAMPPESTKAELSIDIGVSTPTPVVDATRTCLEPIAARIALPVPKDRDTWYQVSFVVIAP